MLEGLDELIPLYKLTEKRDMRDIDNQLKVRRGSLKNSRQYLQAVSSHTEVIGNNFMNVYVLYCRVKASCFIILILTGCESQ